MVEFLLSDSYRFGPYLPELSVVSELSVVEQSSSYLTKQMPLELALIT